MRSQVDRDFFSKFHTDQQSLNRKTFFSNRVVHPQEIHANNIFPSRKISTAVSFNKIKQRQIKTSHDGRKKQTEDFKSAVLFKMKKSISDHNFKSVELKKNKPPKSYNVHFRHKPSIQQYAYRSNKIDR